ncbi:MAG: amidase [Actinobacteria bacterium]|nr:amidase [Actinomycetota bacterium]
MDPAERDAIGWAEGIRAGEVSAAELLAAAEAAASARNPALNAIVTPLWDAPRRSPDAGEGPLAGVPCLVKDLGVTFAGVRHTAGSRLGADVVGTVDSPYARHLLEAGLVIAGVTNTPEFGGSYLSESALFGPTRNPWDLERTAGGSSAGAAAAVAAGIVPVAHGNDAGGSLRAPGSCCGVFALKPSRGRSPRENPLGTVLGDWQVEHVLTRSVRDSAAVLAAGGPPPDIERELRPRRIAVTLDGRGATVDTACKAAVVKAAAALEAQGHSVDVVEPPSTDPAAVSAAAGLWVDAVAAMVHDMEARAGRHAGADDLEPRTASLLREAEGRGAEQRANDWTALHQLCRDLDAFFNVWDVWLTPALSEPPPPISLGQQTLAPEAMIDRDEGFAMYLPLANITGGPAVSLPVATTDAGLPIGVHAMGRRGEDEVLLRLARSLERAGEWTCGPGRVPVVG